MESTNQSGSRPQQKKYVVGSARGLGGAQIFFAGLLMTFGIIGMVLQTLAYFAGVPIWTGLVYLVTGILGVVSSHRNTRCVLIGLLTMSCLSVLMTICGIATAAYAVDGEHWNYFPGPGECHWHCSGLDIARYTIDAANLLFALVELGLSIATIAVCSYTLSNGCCGEGGSRCCGEGGSCCVNGNTGNSYQTMHEVAPGGRLVPLHSLANINYAPAHTANAPSYVISSPIPPQHGDVQQGMVAGTGDQAMTLAHAQQQQQQKNEPPQQQGATPDAHAQPGYVSPPPGYNQA
ncbi:uncharacterized protein LOC118406601 [Branchiostoma floridae]|uniref:Uncharacterized protein LOC118406601 n=1 Tax=Branchiostoma floridae TaxID=7739 RepID=A0A9J7HQN9_BRAFL|nr:uncharacterized protein LOC118406601 [Branchiostoma floridae]XP_035662654.1 uncharacterized protein LOC118406601 [Branchiostoma floridae]XP_035662655.1 uncharacterized protein LOC118406601 [Branchiostoma floridae]